MSSMSNNVKATHANLWIGNKLLKEKKVKATGLQQNVYLIH